MLSYIITFLAADLRCIDCSMNTLGLILLMIFLNCQCAFIIPANHSRFSGKSELFLLASCYLALSSDFRSEFEELQGSKASIHGFKLKVSNARIML